MRSIIASLALGLVLGLLLATVSLGAQRPPEDAMAKSGEVAARVRDVERVVAQSDAALRAGNCDRYYRLLVQVDDLDDELTNLSRAGYPISPEGLERIRQLVFDTTARSCPPLTPQTARQLFQETLTSAMNVRASGNCDSFESRRARYRLRAIIREVEITGAVPPPLLENWKSQLATENALCPERERVPETRYPCPETIAAGVSTALSCRCPAGPYQGTVWGNYYYSADSGLCAAARHAGAIGENGGSVFARVGPRRPYYVSKTRNGITSQWSTAGDRSITFAGVSDPVERRLAEFPLCQHKFYVNPVAERQRGVTCRCIAGSFGFEGTVYGSGPYAADSNICSAARHAGVLRSDDDLVTATAAPGLDRYDPSTRNGVTSEYWGTYPESMTVAAGPQ